MPLSSSACQLRSWLMVRSRTSSVVISGSRAWRASSIWYLPQVRPWSWAAFAVSRSAARQSAAPRSAAQADTWASISAVRASSAPATVMDRSSSRERHAAMTSLSSTCARASW